MSYTRKRPCKVAGCTNLAEQGSLYCFEHRPEPNRDNRSKWKYMYDSKWEKARKRYLTSHCWCEECLKRGDYTLATTVHHKIEHKGDYKLFWDESNWEAICASCHSRIHSSNMNKGK